MLFSISVTCMAVFAGDYIRRMATYGIQDSYAEVTAVRLVIAHMRANDGKWPSDWKQLERHYAYASWNRGMTFERFQDRIWIDFSADIDEMNESADANEYPGYTVIAARYKPGLLFESSPNECIHNYLRLHNHMRRQFGDDALQQSYESW